MPKNYGPSIFVPSDKNVFDALLQKKITHSSLISFLQARGIFISPSTEKHELVNIISSLTLDYFDYIWITHQLENPNRKEKSTYTVIKSDINALEINKACEEIKKDINTSGESLKIERTSKTTKLVITYIDTDFSKTELNQRTTKTCEIDLQTDNSELIVKRPANKKSQEILAKLLLSFEKQKETKIEEFNISLESFVEAEARSFFFDQLIKSIGGFEFDNVSSVDVFHDVDSLGDDDDDDTSSRLGSYITKAALAGSGVLQSKEFNQLHKENFFISKIVWTAISTSKDGDKIELEALFGDASTCSDFKYLVRGVYRYNERSSAHNVTKKSATLSENHEYGGLLRKAAEKAYQDVLDKYGD